MGQTTTVFPGLKKIYRKIIQNPSIDRGVHGIMDILVGVIATMQRFSFPKKFSWDWKWEMLSGAYEHETVDLFQKIIKPGMHVVDIGAHIGYFTRLYSKLVGSSGKVYAFEADPKNFALLERNCHGLANVRLFPEAITDHEGSADFFETENHTGCHSLIASATRPNKISVSATSLDILIEREALPCVDVIKMDIEGAEPRALHGMIQTVQNNKDIALVIELCPANLHEGGTTPEAFMEQLHSLGLRTFAISDDGIKEITSELAKQGEFFIRENYHYVNIYATRLPLF